MLVIAGILAFLAFTLFVLSILRLMRARRDAKFLRRVSEAVDWNPTSDKYAPTLTPAEVAEFNSTRWD